MSRRLTALEWAQERLENTVRIAALKTGEVREGWIEDRDYWRAIVRQLEATAPLEAAVREYLDYLGDTGKALASDEFKLVRRRVVTLACNLFSPRGTPGGAP